MRPTPFDTPRATPSPLRSRLAAALLALALIAAGALAGSASADKQAELAQVQDRQAVIADDLDSQNAAINQLIGQVSEMRSKEAAAQEELDQAQAELDQAEADLAEGRHQLELIRERLERSINALERMLVAIYKDEAPDMIELVMESATWSDAQVQSDYFDRLNDYQNSVIEQVNELREEQAATVAQLADQRDAIESQRDAVAAKRDALASQRAALESREAELTAARADRRAQLAELAGRESDLRKDIARQAAEAQAVAEEQDTETVAAPPVSAPAPVSGSTAQLASDGSAIPPEDAPEQVKAVIEAANQIKDYPYVWGGGHGSFEASGYDCSGAVSYALHGGGFLSTPLDSTGFMSWGEPGVGNWITVYANSGHAYAVIAGLRWDTSNTGGSGPSWSTSTTSFQDPSAFVATHPAGF